MNMGERLFWTGEERWTRQWRLLLLIPSILTLVPAILGLVIAWELLSPTGFGDVLLLVYVLLIFVLPFCIPLIAAEVVLWLGTLYVCKSEYTTAKTVLCCVTAPPSLIVVARYVWFACGILQMAMR